MQTVGMTSYVYTTVNRTFSNTVHGLKGSTNGTENTSSIYWIVNRSY